MKQAIVLNSKELSLLRRGKKLEISVAGEIVQLQAEITTRDRQQAKAMERARMAARARRAAAAKKERKR